MQQIQCRQSSQVLTVQQLLGHMAAAISVVPFSKLNMRPLQTIFLRQFKPHLHFQNRWIRILSRVRQTLAWSWLPERVFQVIPFQQPLPSLILTTDASLQGWGAHMGLLHTHDLWSPEDSILHINVLELKAIFLTVRTFLTHLSGQTVAV